MTIGLNLSRMPVPNSEPGTDNITRNITHCALGYLTPNAFAKTYANSPQK